VIISETCLLRLGDLGILPHHNRVVGDPRCSYAETILSEVLSHQGISETCLLRLGDLGIFPHHNRVVGDPRCSCAETILSEVLSHRCVITPRQSSIPGCNSNFLYGLVVSVKSLRHKYPSHVRSDYTWRSRYIPCHNWVL
jgi:hypothetical protein